MDSSAFTGLAVSCRRRATRDGFRSQSLGDGAAGGMNPKTLFQQRALNPYFAPGIPIVLAYRPLRKAHSGRRLRRCPPRVWRVVAMCFLAFTAYELFLAGTCGPELLGFPPDVAAHAADSVVAHRGQESLAMSPSTAGAPHDHSDEAGCSTEDCFCCCAHISVAGVYVVSILDDAVMTDVAHHVSLPSGSSACLFRPPRTV